MSFFKNLFEKEKKEESIVLIDIGAEGVAGAYVHYQEGELPVLLYTRRLPIEIQKDEPHEKAMLRALETLAADLTREGTPALTRATGRKSIDMILVSVDAPWQETKVRSEDFEEEEPFVFTKSIVNKRLEKSAEVPPEKMLADESIIDITLNGYETHNPYGNKIRRASVIILTSFIDTRVANSIIATLEGAYRTKNILPVAGTSLRYQAMRDIFPHDRDALILDATATSLISLSLIQNGVLATTTQAATPEHDGEWLATITNELTEIAKNYPLPRTIFLLAREPEIAALQEKLDRANFGAVWLSDNPPKIVSVLKSHIIVLIRQVEEGPVDLILLLMILYYQHQHAHRTDEVV